MNIIHNYINGKKISLSKKYSKVFDPSTGEQIANVVMSNSDDFQMALNSSKESQLEWANTTPLKRSRIISKYKNLIEDNIEELAKIICREHGKTFDDAIGSVTRGLEVVEFACGIPHLLKGEFSQNVGTNIDSWSVRQPLGICAGITPFNFPAMVPMWMYPISIACGNSFILKPSEKDPSCSLRLAELFSDAGLPDGVFNVINGDKNVVDLILDTSGQKGTGKWTAGAALDYGQPLSLIAEAVFARCLSSLKEERVKASNCFDHSTYSFTGDKQLFLNNLKHALYASKIISYAQGFQLLKAASNEYKWNLNF